MNLSTIAELRKLLAEATPGPLGSGNPRLGVAAVNALPALLDAAERLAKLESAMLFLHAHERIESRYAPNDVLVMADGLGWKEQSE